MAIGTQITTAYRVEAAAYDALQGFFRMLPVETASGCGAAFLGALGPLSGSAHRTAMRNLRMCFPNETELWRRTVARDAWAEVGRTAAELPHMFEFARNSERLIVEGAERFEAAKESGAVFIAGHFSNWEAMALGIVQSGVVCHVTYRPANNPLIDQRIVEERAKYGVRLQAAKGIEGGMALARALKRKETVALMNDQKYNEGVSAPFFGYNCMTADGPTRMALRNRVPLMPISIQRVGPVRFRMQVHEALPLDYDAPEETEIPASVARINAFIEARIREAPAQWFWMHQRWPKSAWAEAGVL